MTADEMFRKLGYRKDASGDIVIYRKTDYYNDSDTIHTDEILVSRELDVARKTHIVNGLRYFIVPYSKKEIHAVARLLEEMETDDE